MKLDPKKYPIGQYNKPKEIDTELLEKYISDIELFPNRLKLAVQQLTDPQLETEYRDEGWTIRQVVHHCADSHMNSFIRLKLALTENNPTIKPYLEDHWAELEDGKNHPIAPSIKMLEGIHERWAALLKSITPKEWERTYFHPQSGIQYQLDEYVGLYAWHCNHHLAHITELLKAKGW